MQENLALDLLLRSNMDKITTITHYFALQFVLISIWVRQKMLNSLPDYKILDWSKLKQIADDILMCI